MKNPGSALKVFIILFMILSSQALYAQNTDCKVLLPEISGTYAGECKNGLAHGNGIATGTDRYEGQFTRGLPNGKGTYAWSGGTIYKGEWSKGVKDGEGEIVYQTAKGDSVVKGFWKAGNYVGEKNIPSYSVIRKDNLLSVNFRKLDATGSEVIIRFLLKGQQNRAVSNLSMTYTSGTQFKTGTYEGLQSIRYPLDLKITYSTRNPVSRSSFDVVFECTINEPGKWEITLNN